MQPYLDMAADLGIEVEVIRMTGDYGSIHGVPAHAMQAMKDRFEDFEGEVIL